MESMLNENGHKRDPLTWASKYHLFSCQRIILDNFQLPSALVLCLSKWTQRGAKPWLPSSLSWLLIHDLR